MDVLWKPVLRTFRTHLRDFVSRVVDIQHLRDHGEQGLPHVLDQCRTLLRSMGAPEELVEVPLNLHALILLMLPVGAQNMDRALRRIPTVRSSRARLLPIFCKIFRENSKRVRL